MIKPPDLSATAPWKLRFNAPRFLLAYMARANPARGIVIGNQVLIIQGKHDTRTPPRQIEVYEAKMKARGKSIEVEWFEAGHTGLSAEQWIHFQERMMLFAQRVLASQHRTP